jgi:protein-disulfide isomerase
VPEGLNVILLVNGTMEDRNPETPEATSESIPTPPDAERSEKETSNVIVRKSAISTLVAVTIAAVAVAAFLGGYVVGGGGIGVNDERQIARDLDSGGTAQPTLTREEQGQQASSLAGSIRAAITLGDDPIKGSSDAPVTMIEFSDFQCPFCKRFFDDTLPLIQRNYIDTDKVRFVYKDFPLDSIHPNARAAAVASECADEQAKFWIYHDRLFMGQGEWAGIPGNDAVGIFKQYASDLGLQVTEFNACLDAGKYADEVNSDLRDGVTYGVNGTPSFFIGNEKDGYVQVRGAQPYSVFEQVINSELAG